MLIHDLKGMDRQEKQIKYEHALIAFMLYFISDAFWAWVDAGALPVTRFSVVVTNFSNFVFMALITYTWLEYVMAYEQIPKRTKKSTQFAMLLPFLLSLVLLVAIYILAPQTLLSDDLKLQPLYNVFLLTVPYIYIIAVIIYAVSKARKEENPIEKKRHLYIGFFPLMVVGGGLIQIVIVPETPIFSYAAAILMLIIYLQSMESRISMDPLTGLNNRGQLVRYVSQKNNLRITGRKTFVVMFDVNKFKSINDTYGHAEGDRALILIADALRNTVRQHNIPLFLGRFGGDEFIIVAHPAERSQLDELLDEVRNWVEISCRTERKPYTLTIGIGVDELLAPPDSFQSCLHRADQQLYLDKKHPGQKVTGATG
jgi:diguanylate cyclase (GGDEF)-like protein